MPAAIGIVILVFLIGHLIENWDSWGPVVLGLLLTGLLAAALCYVVPKIYRFLLDIFDPKGVEHRKQLDEVRKRRKLEYLAEKTKQREIERKRQIELTRYRDPNMTGIEFEHWCATRLNALGWQAWTTRASGDQGADVIARKDGKTVVVQCKLYRRPVGNKAVQEAFAARAHYRAYAAVVITSNDSFTPSAYELAQSTGVELFRADQIEYMDRILR